MSSKQNKKNEGTDSKVALKLKITDLEGEIATLKQRLDSLRKAKNNTITKREREVIQVSEMALGRHTGVDNEKYKALEQKYSQSEKRRIQAEKDFAELKAKADEEFKNKNAMEKDKDEWKIICERLEEKVKKLEKQNADADKYCAQLREKSAELEDLTTEVQRLREKLEVKAMQEEHKHRENNDREGYIDKLSNENVLLREKVETLYEELSLKEAKWTDWEEKFKKKSEEKWNERYVKWMAKTEDKIRELQEANNLLRGYLEKDKKVTERKVSGFTEEDGNDIAGQSTSKKNK